MKICIDGLPFFLNKWDLGDYSRELVSKLSKESSLSLFLLKDKEIQSSPINMDSSYINFSDIQIDRINDTYTPIIKYLKSNNINTYHCFNNGFSLHKDMSNIYVITTFHNIIPLEYEDYYKDCYKNKFFNTLPIALKNTNKFIATSNSMKNKLINLCNVSNKNIQVVYPIISEDFQPMNKYMSHIYLRSKFNITDDFILFTGDFHKRKRIEDLLEIFFRISHLNENLKFILLTYINEVNIDYFNEINILIKGMGLSSKVKFITNFSTAEKVHFFNGALCFIDLSLYDDMNISMIQAFKCKCPIICSDISFHREILGNCGVFVDMDSYNSLDYIENYILNIKDIELYKPKDYLENIKNFDVCLNVNKLVDIYNCTKVY